MKDVEGLAKECPQDPACLRDEGGACIACLFVPEFVCGNFNNDLDRDCLVGDGNTRYEGFFNER